MLLLLRKERNIGKGIIVAKRERERERKGEGPAISVSQQCGAGGGRGAGAGVLKLNSSNLILIRARTLEQTDCGETSGHAHAFSNQKSATGMTGRFSNFGDNKSQ